MAGALSGLERPSGRDQSRRVARVSHRARLLLALLGGIAAAASIGSCAYGTSTASLPGHLKTVGIPVFENETTEYTLPQEITDATVKRFVTDNHLRVVDERSANGVVQGRVTDYRNTVFGISDISLAQEYRVSITVAVVFKDQVKNRELWTDEITKTANYYVTNVPGDSARTEQDGRKLAVQRIADEILTRSVESW